MSHDVTIKEVSKVQAPVERESCVLEVDIAAIPDFRRIELAKGALSLVDRVFAMPGAEERYQAWLAERRGRKH